MQETKSPCACPSPGATHNPGGDGPGCAEGTGRQGRGDSLQLDTRPAEEQPHFSSTGAEGARAEATAPTQGTSLAPTGARQERRGGGGGGKVSWGKALKGPERGVTLWQSREGGLGQALFSPHGAGLGEQPME